jgi:very-short-patch-repair endonuclease
MLLALRDTTARVVDLTSYLEPDGAQIAHRRFTTADLRGLHWTKRHVRRAVESGALLPVRRGSFLLAGDRSDVIEAAKEGGRLACTSVLEPLGVFVLRRSRTHLHFERGVSKATSKASSKARAQTWHWAPLIRTPHPRATVVDVIDALAQATACQSPRAAVATLDSALHLALVTQDDLDEIFDRVPPRRRVLRRLLDGRAESGPETILRLIALALGFTVELQVELAGVGRVDLVLDGWLVVECDSEQFHSGWESQKKDRRRDLALAALGYTSIRPIAEDILHRPEVVIAALRGLRAARAAQG